MRIGEEFARDPDDTIAVGGNIRIANGALIEGNVVVEPRIPTGGTEASQTAEYLRSFLGGRIAWSRMNGLLIISGAFGVFRRDLLRASGGRPRRRSARTWRSSCACTTSSAPRTRRRGSPTPPTQPRGQRCPPASPRFRSQRIRWHVGLIDNLRLHQKMLGRRDTARRPPRAAVHDGFRGVRAAAPGGGLRDPDRDASAGHRLLVVRGRVLARHAACRASSRRPGRC